MEGTWGILMVNLAAEKFGAQRKLRRGEEKHRGASKLGLSLPDNEHYF